jgi:hypothetical protein
MTTIEQSICGHLTSQPNQLKKFLSAAFHENDIAVIEDLLPHDLKDALHKEANELMSASAQRRDLVLEATGGTPRAYASVDRDTIFECGSIIKAIFESDTVRKYLSDVAGEPLHKVPYQPEEYIINSQEKSGDTHGWHWDDYTFALIWVVQAPDQLAGGRVEYVAATDWDKNNPRRALIDILGEREVRSRYIDSGCCYLMRANTTLHRVAPLMGDTRRTVIVFTYASDLDLTDPNISHETMEQIYADEIQKAEDLQAA